MTAPITDAVEPSSCVLWSRNKMVTVLQTTILLKFISLNESWCSLVEISLNSFHGKLVATPKRKSIFPSNCYCERLEENPGYLYLFKVLYIRRYIGFMRPPASHRPHVDHGWHFLYAPVTSRSRAPYGLFLGCSRIALNKIVCPLTGPARDRCAVRILPPRTGPVEFWCMHSKFTGPVPV